MTTLYLDVDDEITSAASQMRATGEARLALVLPAGSRLGTSRINFRLLAREAALRGKHLAIVTPEGPTRALAASAGLPVFATVFEYEEALATAAAANGGSTGPAVEAATVPGGAGGAPVSGGAAWAADAPPAAGAGAGSPRRADADVRAGSPSAGGPIAPGVAGDGSAEARMRGLDGDAGTSRGGGGSPGGDPSGLGAGDSPGGGSPGAITAPRSNERPHPRSAAAGSPASARAGDRRGPRVAIIVALAVVALVVLAGGVAAWTLLPSAVVEIAARAAPIALQVAVRADPSAEAIDAAAGVVPAERPRFEVAVSDEFPATGVKVDETTATGTVRFRNCDPGNSYRIRSGSSVATSSGVRFTTRAEIFLPVAIFDPATSRVDCQTGEVDVEATAPGPAGNVGAGSITRVPSNVNANLVFVTNPAATSGGTRTETTVVDQADLDEALAVLHGRLADALAAAAADPANVPAGRVAFPGTASMSEPTPTEDPAALVGRAVESFTLGLSATGTVTAVDEAAVRAVAEERLRASVAADHDLVADSVTVDVGAGAADGEAVAFDVAVAGREVRRLDAEAIRSAIRGRPVEEARRILAEYGEATVTTWPDWVTSIPTLDARLDVRVVASPGGDATGSAP